MQLLDLAAMHQQLARAVGIVRADAVRHLIRGNVHTVQPQLPVDDAGEGIGDLRVPLAQRLHLAATEHDARLERVDDVVVAMGAPVTGNELVAELVGAVAVGCHSGLQGSGTLPDR